MLANCQQWRKTVEGVGIDELYRRIDPFDVSVFSFTIVNVNEKYYWIVERQAFVDITF